jgi:hypothetical protein
MAFYETKQLFKHEAIAGIPFNLEILLNKFYTDWLVKKLIVRDIKNNVVFEYEGLFVYDYIKNMWYVENVVIDEPGLYYSEFILENNNKEISIKEQFKVTSLNLVNGWVPRTYVKFIKATSIPELGEKESFSTIVYLYSDEPVLFLDEVHIVHTDVERTIKPKWYHQVAPQVFKIVINTSELTKQNSDNLSSFKLGHIGILNVEMKLYGLLRDEPYIISSSLSIT